VQQPVNTSSEETRDIDRFLFKMVERRGSDLHIKSGSTPKIRVDGQITDLSREVLSPMAVDRVLKEVMSDADRAILAKAQEVDFTYQIRTLGRFRFNVYQQMNGVAIAVRHIRIDIPTLEELHLPPSIYKMITSARGLVLVTGATGSGKSTTLASMIETLNRTSPLNIITIEDPIEFMFKEKRSTIQQREVGRDTPNWGEALRHIMRQDPDVIMLGEIRDAETMQIALTAANTGHLVLATMHTMDAAQTVNRVIGFASSDTSAEVRFLLASTLVGVVAQRLLPLSDQTGRIPAVEILICTETIRKMIIDPQETLKIRQAMSDGFGQYGMQTFDQSLMQLYRTNLITLEDALRFASSQTDFRVKMRGIDGQGDSAWIQAD